ncbi:MAG: hypothetical protein LBJ14_03540 [Desulfarculales bacterium]|jgi:CRISPR/Cas system CSM-associated protein Csm2 small subunit|nr:hypothetical protein [Desulfarculales bacterium]
MSTISALLNLDNNDYQTTLFNRKKNHEEDLSKAIAKQQQREEFVQEQVVAQNQIRQALRQIDMIDQEIQELSWEQAQQMTEMVSMRIAGAENHHLAQIQSPVSGGLLPPAYI